MKRVDASRFLFMWKQGTSCVVMISQSVTWLYMHELLLAPLLLYLPWTILDQLEQRFRSSASYRLLSDIQRADHCSSMKSPPLYTSTHAIVWIHSKGIYCANSWIPFTGRSSTTNAYKKLYRTSQVWIRHLSNEISLLYHTTANHLSQQTTQVQLFASCR